MENPQLEAAGGAPEGEPMPAEATEPVAVEQPEAEAGQPEPEANPWDALHNSAMVLSAATHVARELAAAEKAAGREGYAEQIDRATKCADKAFYAAKATVAAPETAIDASLIRAADRVVNRAYKTLREALDTDAPPEAE